MKDMGTMKQNPEYVEMIRRIAAETVRDDMVTTTIMVRANPEHAERLMAEFKQRCLELSAWVREQIG